MTRHGMEMGRKSTLLTEKKIELNIGQEEKTLKNQLNR